MNRPAGKLAGGLHPTPLNIHKAHSAGKFPIEKHIFYVGGDSHT